jgi:antitoxin component of MazEF toxin-antitoxin module
MWFETFIGTVREAGNGSKEITLPHNLVKFMGLRKGDQVKVMIKKEVGNNVKS